MLCSLAFVTCGCAVFTQPAKSTAQAGFSWLTNWGGPPLISPETFDLNQIRPPSSPGTIVAESLLEITVWDLFEPGKPHTFPVRVSPRNTVDVPLVGELSVDGSTLPQVETALADAYRSHEYLLNPRVLVRSLDAPRIKIHVSGAVNRPGFVELTRDDSSVFAALVTAGGLRKTAGTHISLTRGALSAASRTRTAPVAAPAAETIRSQSPTANAPSGVGNVTALRANSTQVLSVSAGPEATPETAATEALGTSAAASPRAVDGNSRKDPKPPVQRTIWYDLSLPGDRIALAELRLVEGDTVNVKGISLPIRIAGAVERPGNYAIPVGRTLNVWQALELAGGVTHTSSPLNVALYRPASEGRAAQRWFLHVNSISERPETTPSVEPGDMIHIESSAKEAIKSAVGNLWPK